MKKFFEVCAAGREKLATKVIEAETAEEAREKYFDMWCDGDVEAFDYMMDFGEVEEIKEGEGE